MANSFISSGFAPDDQAADEENLSGLGLHEVDEDGLEEKKAKESDLEETEDFDLEDEGDLKIAPPVFGGSLGSARLDAEESAEEEAEAGDEEELEEEDGEAGEDEDDEEAEESDLEPAADDQSNEVDAEDDGDDYSEDDGLGGDSLIVSKTKIALARRWLENIRENTERLREFLGSVIGDDDEERVSIAEISDGLIETEESGGQIIEGIFNGENMIGPDGKEYSVPANYASKSKLVEGDMLKLTITDRGTFRYKQTKPIERKRLIGKLEKDGNGSYLVKAEHKKFRVITASITYYKGVPGDKVVLLIPVAGDSAWGAVENVIKSK